jgi:hypothetical protein
VVINASSDDAFCAGVLAVLHSRCLVIKQRRSPRQARSCETLLCLSRRDMGDWRKERLLTNDLSEGREMSDFYLAFEGGVCFLQVGWYLRCLEGRGREWRGGRDWYCGTSAM